MTPAFFAPQLRTFLPLFQDMALKVRCFVDTDTTQKVIRNLRQLAQKWKDEVISLDPTGQPLVNVTPWLSRATLDVIGEGE
jgi:hypothetical protein